jgi:transcriptional regulator with XRE-family HTH domain
MRLHGVDPEDLARISPERIGALLREARTDRAVAVGVVAGRAGIRRRQLRRWEKGDGRPSPDEIGRLAEALDLSVDGLVPPRSPVAYHVGTGTLTVGDRTAAVVRRAGDADDNEAVLRTYVDAVARSRGCPPASGFALRRDDIVVLADLLDLDDVQLEARLVRLLGMTSAEAAVARGHLLGRRAAVLAATATAGVIASFPLAAAASDGVSSTPPATASANVLVTAAPSEPASAPAAPVVVVAAAAESGPNSSPPPTTAPEHTVSSVQLPNDADGDGIDIGDALVIERGNAPADPATQIGDAVTYER